MRKEFLCPMFVFLTLTCSSGTQRAGEKSPTKPDPVGAPIWYEDMMLVFSDGNGVAAVVFKKEFVRNTKNRWDMGVQNEFRYLGNDAANEVKGEGLICEKWRYEPTDDPKKFDIIDEGSRKFIEAGSIHVEWSSGGKGRGWIYYFPESVSVQIGYAKHFADVDLKRFRKSGKSKQK